MGSIGRFFKALGYLFTGRMDKYRETVMKDPVAMRAAYNDVVAEKKKSIHQYKEAVAGMIAQREKKKARLEQLTADIQRLSRLKAGAQAKAQKRVQALQAQGATKAVIKGDEEYVKCASAFKDFTSTLAEKEARVAELEDDVRGYDKRVQEHKLQIQSLLRDLEKLAEEREDAVADVISAKEEAEVADMLTGLSQDGSAAELASLRDIRARAKAEAQISKELAGTDTRMQEEEFLDFARQAGAEDEFDALIDFAEDTDNAAAQPVSAGAVADARLPD